MVDKAKLLSKNATEEEKRIFKARVNAGFEAGGLGGIFGAAGDAGAEIEKATIQSEKNRRANLLALRKEMDNTPKNGIKKLDYGYGYEKDTAGIILS